jgi:hypothetical protein
MLTVLLLAQAVSPPDIQMRATAEIRSVKVEKNGAASLTVRADPDGGRTIKVEAPKVERAKRLRNVQVTVDAQARIASPAQATRAEEPR